MKDINPIDLPTKENIKERQNNSITKRIVYFDILNILACLSVVFLHCNKIVHSYTDTKEWAQSLIVEVVCYFAVPIFLMLTGANLMNYRKKYDTKTFFKKRVIKVLIPFIFWAIAMMIWKVSIKEVVIEKWTPLEILKMTFLNTEDSVYYFMFIILGVYLTLPILSILAEEKYRKTLWYAVIVMFITKSVLDVTSPYTGYSSHLSILFDGYLIFVMLGYLLSTMELDRKIRYSLYILAIVSCLIRYFVTYFLSKRDGTLNSSLFGYVQFHSVLLTVGVFEFIKNINWDKIIKKEKIKKVLTTVAGCSFGVYLIHKIVMYYEIALLNLDESSLVWRTLWPIITYLITLAIVYVLKKVPIIRKIVP